MQLKFLCDTGMCGKVRTETIKRLAHDIYHQFGNHFDKDFNHNKLILGKIARSTSKHFRNKIAGYITRLAVIERNKEKMDDNKGFNP